MPAAGNALAQREELIAAAISLELPERVPIVYQGEAFSPRYMGVPLATYATDPDAAVAATLGALDRLQGFDAISTVPGGRIGVLLASIWMTHVSIPGRELPADTLWQAAEKADMTVADYDVILTEGWTAFEAAFQPRVLDVAELSETNRWLEAEFEAAVAAFREHDFVPLSGAIVATPFERLCGARSMPEFFLDLYRRPRLVRQVMDAMLPAIVEESLAIAQACALPSIWVGGWRSASAMLTEHMWEEFVFPDLKTLVTALVDAGIKPTLHFDQDWTRDLPRLRELPAGSCILNLDGMTDIRRAKEVLGDHMAIMGDVPATLLVTGTPDDVREYVRRLLADVGRRGILLAPGCDIPVNARAENVEALVAAGLEYGAERKKEPRLMHQDLYRAIIEFREDDALRLAGDLAKAGVDPADILETGRLAMSRVGESFEKGEAFIPELVMAGAIMRGIASILKPMKVTVERPDERSTVVLGTVSGDIHDIGKDVVGMMLETSGFNVVDLGVDVPPDHFVAEASRAKADVVALSCLLTVAFDSMKATVDALAQAGLRDTVHVMIGGAPVNEQLCSYVAADGWGADAVAAVRLARAWAGVSA